MRTRVLAALVLVALVLATVTPAAGQDKVRSMWLGVGLQSCGTYLEVRKLGRGSEAPFSHWLSGFLSALAWSNVSRGSKDFLAGTDLDGRLAWLDQYCREHPLDDFSTASVVLYEELRLRAAK